MTGCRSAAEFDWPGAPRRDGSVEDLRVLTGAASSCAFTTHLMDRGARARIFAAFAPAARLVFGYVWKRADFPWLGIWEENHSRTQAPWNGRTLTRGMEFGVSPMPESRRQMVDRGKLFGVPAYRWLPAKARAGSGVLRGDGTRGRDSGDARGSVGVYLQSYAADLLVLRLPELRSAGRCAERGPVSAHDGQHRGSVRSAAVCRVRCSAYRHT